MAHPRACKRCLLITGGWGQAGRHIQAPCSVRDSKCWWENSTENVTEHTTRTSQQAVVLNAFGSQHHVHKPLQQNILNSCKLDEPCVKSCCRRLFGCQGTCLMLNTLLRCCFVFALVGVCIVVCRVYCGGLVRQDVSVCQQQLTARKPCDGAGS